MRKSEFIKALAENSGLSQRDCEKVVDAMTPVIVTECVETVVKSACHSVNSNRKSTLRKLVTTR